jgi:hypothetical protein
VMCLRAGGGAMVRTEVVGGIDVARADVAQLVKVRQNVPRLAKIDHLAFGEEQDQVERRHHLRARLVDGADDRSALGSVSCAVCARAYWQWRRWKSGATIE